MCEIKPKTTTVLGTVWMKGSTILSESQRVKFEDQKVIIKQTNENDTGYYTCSVKTHFGSLNKTAYLTVIETEEENDGKYVRCVQGTKIVSVIVEQVHSRLCCMHA